MAQQVVQKTLAVDEFVRELRQFPASAMGKNARASPRLPAKARSFYGASRSASDATSLLYTTTLVLRGRRTPPVGSVGSCVGSYRRFLARTLVKVFASVTENR
jgi:hypothetical protein